MGDDVQEQKNRERIFREKTEPYGEFTLREKSAWWNLVELKNAACRLDLRPGQRILDAGCSDGRFLDFLAAQKKGFDLVGFDFALNPLKATRARGIPAGLVCADICRMPFKSSTFDRAVALGVVQQIPGSEERARALRDFYRVLRPGGRFAIQVLNRASWKDMVANGKEGPLLTCPELYVYLYDENDLRCELTAAGFSVKEIMGSNYVPVRYLKKMGVVGVFLDMLMTRIAHGWSFPKGRYLLAICEK